MTAKIKIIAQTETEGLGKKHFVRHPNGTYELGCSWSGGARVYLTPEEARVFGEAMARETQAAKEPVT